MTHVPKRFYDFGPFKVDTLKRVLSTDGKPIPLQPKAFDTLQVLVQSAGQVVEKEKLMNALWPDSFVEEANLSQNVSVLRKALGESPGDHRYVVTVPGRGYSFVGKVTVLENEAVELGLGESHQLTRRAEQQATMVVQRVDELTLDSARLT